MSMVQDLSQHYRVYGDAGSRYHTRHGSASSVLAATTFGVPYNPLATPSNASAYGSVSWPCSHTVSPSIWSQSHQGRVQWPSSTNQERPCANYYGGYAYMQRPYGYPMYSSQQPSVHQVPAMPQHQPQHQQPQQIQLSSQHPGPIAQMPQQVHHHSLRQNVDPQMLGVNQVPSQMQPAAAGQMMASYLPPQPIQLQQVPHVTQYSLRAPLQPYQSITPPDAATPSSEYDLTMFSKFYLAVATGLYPEDLLPEEIASLEQYFSSLLCATRLPKSTVLVSLVYLNQMHRLANPELIRSDLKTQLLCSLVLANKINDDNTFTSASWSLVSGIPAKQITKIELSWLDAFNWRLNLEQNGIAEWNYWKKCWSNYEQSVNSQCMQSPVSLQGVWAPGGFVYEPYSVAVC